MTAIENGPPKECNSSHTSGFFESLKSSITNIFHFPENECEQYYLITSISPALRVPPTEVSKTTGFNAANKKYIFKCSYESHDRKLCTNVFHSKKEFLQTNYSFIDKINLIY